MAKKGNTKSKASQITRVLENLAIQEYTLYSNFFVGSPKVIEINNPKEYYKIVKNLDLISSTEYVGSPCYINKLQVKYKGWVLKTTINPEDSELSYIISELEKKNLIKEGDCL
jgi:hypothetical protein